MRSAEQPFELLHRNSVVAWAQSMSYRQVSFLRKKLSAAYRMRHVRKEIHVFGGLPSFQLPLPLLAL